MKKAICFLALFAGQNVWSLDKTMTCMNPGEAETKIIISENNEVTIHGLGALEVSMDNSPLEMHLVGDSRSNFEESIKFTYFVSKYQPNPIEAYQHMEVVRSEDGELIELVLTALSYNDMPTTLRYSPANCTDPQNVMNQISQLGNGR